MLLALAAGRKLPLTEAGANHMVKLLRCSIPHHVQMFFDHVHTTYVLDEMSGEVTIETIERVFRESMTGLKGHPELSHMEERLRQVLDRDQFQLALTLLTETAATGMLPPEVADKISRALYRGRADRDNELNNVIAILEHDGYLQRAPKHHEFVSALVESWWANRFGRRYNSVQKPGREP